MYLISPIGSNLTKQVCAKVIALVQNGKKYIALGTNKQKIEKKEKIEQYIDSDFGVYSLCPEEFKNDGT